MSDTDLDVAKELGLTGIKKYWRHTDQVEIELDWLHDKILSLTIFVRHLYRVYNNKKVCQNISVRQNTVLELVSSFFVQLHGLI